MSRITLLSLVLTAALLGFGGACAGGGEEYERVGIRRIDFTGVELSAADFFDPPSVEQYPTVVAEVNGEPITGEALAARQVMLELNRRQTIDVGFDLLREQLLADIESTDPLEALIDKELQRQAVERLGLLPPYEEAVAFTRKAEEAFTSAFQQASPEQRQERQELLRLLGMPAEDWASSEEIVETYRKSMGLAALRGEVCTRTTWPDQASVAVLSFRYDCGEFLEKERKDADIRYFVKWVD